MRKNRFSEEQITSFTSRARPDSIKELCRKGGFSDATFCK